MDRTAMFDALRQFAPGSRIKPEWVPLIDAVANAMGLPTQNRRKNWLLSGALCQRALSSKMQSGHSVAMPDPTPKSDHIAARFFAALFAVGAVGLIGSVLWNIHTGVAQAKIGGAIVRSSDLNGFWTNIAFQVALALFFTWQAYRIGRLARV